jgi:hypothetical protein
MTVCLRTAFLVILSAFAVGLPGKAKAQELSCDSLQRIINIVAADPALSSIKGAFAAEGNGDEGKTYYSLASLWDRLDDVRGQYIAYDKVRKAYSFHAFIYSYNSPDEELAATLKIFKDCLGAGWISGAAHGKPGGTVTYLKNPAKYLVITIRNLKGTIRIECYKSKQVTISTNQNKAKRRIH